MHRPCDMLLTAASRRNFSYLQRCLALLEVGEPAEAFRDVLLGRHPATVRRRLMG